MRYGLWHQARLEQVSENLATGVIETEKTVSFDTTHVEANSHCGNVVPPDAKVEVGKKPKQRKVPRMRKRCGCGKDNWETCTHAWVPTDKGAAVVVKGPTRVFWAHKTRWLPLPKAKSLSTRGSVCTAPRATATRWCHTSNYWSATFPGSSAI